MEEEILVHCLMKDSMPYKVIKSIKPNNRAKILELAEKLGIPEPELYDIAYRLTPFASVREGFVEIDRRYDFVIAGDTTTANGTSARARKYNEDLHENSWGGGVIIM